MKEIKKLRKKEGKVRKIKGKNERNKETKK